MLEGFQKGRRWKSKYLITRNTNIIITREDNDSWKKSKSTVTKREVELAGTRSPMVKSD